jgi:hypothetical protein
MADFRRCLYALALVALLAGFTVSASAQTFNCTQTTGVPPIVRAEGYTELMGDLVLDCTGGNPTPPGQVVPPVNIAVNLDVPVTSQVTAVLNSVEFLESLLIVDEPNSSTNPTKQLLNCGRTEAPDNLQSGAGVCSILGGGALGARNTYDGTNFHPNVFQGRSFVLLTGQTNQVLFAGVPIDPPGTLCAASDPGNTGTVTNNVPCHRIIRITNIRGDATSKSVGAGNSNTTTTITASIQINPAAGLPVDIPDHSVARILPGLSTLPAITAKNDFIQCNALAGQNLNGINYTFQEGFENAFKPQSLTQELLNGAVKPNYNYAPAGGVATPNLTPGVLNNQNVPGSVYDTESGFTNQLAATAGDVPTNPQTGGPPTGGSGAGKPFSNTGGLVGDMGIGKAGIASQGTRLALIFTGIPNGAQVLAPNVVLLTNVISNTTTGVAVLMSSTTASGALGTAAGAGLTPTTVVAGGNAPILTNAAGPYYLAVYEVFFANPNALEKAVVALQVTGFGTPSPNLSSNLPQPNQTANVQGSFAPFYDSGVVPAARTTTFEIGSEVLATSFTTPVATLAIPRFKQTLPANQFFTIGKCSCNLLFPFVTNAATAGGSYDTSFAIANTSLDPGNKTPGFFGFKGSAQNGPVQFWYYNRNNQTTFAEPPNLPGTTTWPSGLNTQCTNATTIGACPGTAIVPAGGILLGSLANGAVIQGSTTVTGPVLLPVPNFTGYMIVQTGFQYCHGFAYISKAGAGFTTDNTAMGYLALVLDQGPLPRTSSTGENIAH